MFGRFLAKIGLFFGSFCLMKCCHAVPGNSDKAKITGNQG